MFTFSGGPVLSPIMIPKPGRPIRNQHPKEVRPAKNKTKFSEGANLFTNVLKMLEKQK